MKRALLTLALAVGVLAPTADASAQCALIEHDEMAAITAPAPAPAQEVCDSDQCVFNLAGASAALTVDPEVESTEDAAETNVTGELVARLVALAALALLVERKSAASPIRAARAEVSSAAG